MGQRGVMVVLLQAVMVQLLRGLLLLLMRMPGEAGRTDAADDAARAAAAGATAETAGNGLLRCGPRRAARQMMVS